MRESGRSEPKASRDFERSYRTEREALKRERAA
jgi:hypothetical protein